MLRFLTILFFSLSFSTQIQASDNIYQHGIELGVNPRGIIENSGMAYSKLFDRLYIINDSGNGNYFFITDMHGNLIEKVKISDAKNVDYEGLSYAPCGTDNCLYIGDIGDNGEDDSHHHIYIIKEVGDFHNQAKVKTDIIFTYEDGVKPNAESLAVHPISGDIFIATKNYDGNATFIYKIKKSVFSDKERVKTEAKLVGEINFTTLDTNLNQDFTRTTDMAFSPSGNKFLMLTVQSQTVWEFDINLANFNSLEANNLFNNFKIHPIDYLGQEESLCYYNEDEFIYSTEGKATPIIKVNTKP